MKVCKWKAPHSTHQHLQQKEAAMTKQKLDGKREPAAPPPGAQREGRRQPPAFRRCNKGTEAQPGGNHETQNESPLHPVHPQLYAAGAGAGQLAAGQLYAEICTVHVCAGAHRLSVSVCGAAGRRHGAHHPAVAGGRRAGRPRRPPPHHGNAGRAFRAGSIGGRRGHAGGGSHRGHCGAAVRAVHPGRVRVAHRAGLHAPDAFRR